MTDIRIISINSMAGVDMDWLLTPRGTLDETQELATAVKIALGTDALASLTDILPGLEDDTDRRGFWGDLDATLLFDGWPIGSLLWLLRRSAIRPLEAQEGSTLARAETYTYEALRPFLDRRICSRIEVQADRVGINQIAVQVVMYRGPLPAISLQFQSLWDEIGQ
jgi:phage gp46-like protein